MILKLKDGEVKVLENSCEQKNEAIIYLRFEDYILTNKDRVVMFIDDKPIEQLDRNVWKINHSIHVGNQNKVVVGLVRDGKTILFKGNFIIKNYISFGPLGYDSFPQVLLDINKSINELEKRIKKLENINTVI